ncbi:MAG: type II toxin-antitoxin system VapC family toxin [Thermoleophilia bacterium]
MRVFFDTSALVKRYIEEPGSDDVAGLLEDAESLIVSALLLPECMSAFQRLAREGRLSPREYEQLKGTVLADLVDVTICHVVPEVIDIAVGCLERYPLRTLDAVQLGCACAVVPDLFVTADQRRGMAARGEGLEVRLV